MLKSSVAALALIVSTAAGAQVVAEHHTTTTTTTKPTLSTKGTQTVNKTTNTTARDMHGNMASATTKTGKKVTYDCSKAGNKTKSVCKK